MSDIIDTLYKWAKMLLSFAESVIDTFGLTLRELIPTNPITDAILGLLGEEFATATLFEFTINTGIVFIIGYSIIKWFVDIVS